MKKTTYCIAKIFILLSFEILFGQKEDFEKLTAEDYKIINDVYGNSSKEKKIVLYQKSYFDKSWSRYFQNPSLICNNVGIPTTVSDSTLKSLLTDKVLKKFINSIQISLPLEIDKKLLKSTIQISSSFDEKKDLANGVIRISKPIIHQNIAVIRGIRANEAPIHIIEKRNGKWHIIYTFYDWLILE